MSGWPPGGEAYDVEPVAGRTPAYVILPPVPAPSADEDAPIGLNCPGCGEPPRMVLPGGNQAFCGNTDSCRILMWDPTQTRAEMTAEGIREIDLREQQ